MVSGADMSNHRSQSSASSITSAKRHATTSSRQSTKSRRKDADWTDVTDPEERRRIQNRVAQRKFREKARETKERTERELRNQEHAGNSYQVPTSTNLEFHSDFSGLPWGSMDLGIVVSRGHEMQSQQSSGHGTYVGDERSINTPYATYDPSLYQATSYGSGADEEAYYDEINYAYDATQIQAYGMSSL